MEGIIQTFLKIKHWQFFLLLLFFSAIPQIILSSGVTGIKKPESILQIFVLITFSIFGGWIYSVALSFHKLVPKEIKMNFKLFKFFFGFLILYFLFIAVYTIFIYDVDSSNLVLIPLHIFAVFSLLYCLFFIARALRIVELQRKVTLNDFLTEFFLIWFFPIGIWILQPRINKIFVPTYISK